MSDTELEGFTLEEAERVAAVYACSQCEGDLQIIASDWNLAFEENEIFYVVCPDCGNIEQIGRISKVTVSIRNEHGVFEFPRAIRALPEFWGSLQSSREELIKSLGF